MWLTEPQRTNKPGIWDDSGFAVSIGLGCRDSNPNYLIQSHNLRYITTCIRSHIAVIAALFDSTTCTVSSVLAVIWLSRHHTHWFPSTSVCGLDIHSQYSQIPPSATLRLSRSCSPTIVVLGSAGIVTVLPSPGPRQLTTTIETACLLLELDAVDGIQPQPQVEQVYQVVRAHRGLGLIQQARMEAETTGEFSIHLARQQHPCPDTRATRRREIEVVDRLRQGVTCPLGLGSLPFMRNRQQRHERSTASVLPFWPSRSRRDDPLVELTKVGCAQRSRDIEERQELRCFTLPVAKRATVLISPKRTEVIGIVDDRCPRLFVGDGQLQSCVSRDDQTIPLFVGIRPLTYRLRAGNGLSQCSKPVERFPRNVETETRVPLTRCVGFGNGSRIRFAVHTGRGELNLNLSLAVLH